MVLVATQVKRRRGTTAENDAFTGAEGEITVDTERHELRVHDGATQGGFRIGGGSGSGRNIGDIFYTMRNDTGLAGAVECNGATYNTTDFQGADNIGALLEAGKLPYVSMSQYATLLSTNGSVGVFGWNGSGNTEFRVPSLNDIFIETGTVAQIGDYLPAGVPNITGEAGMGDRGANINASGAFSAVRLGSSTPKYTSQTNTVSTNNGWTFDASHSSDVYKDDVDTVQPNTTRYRAMVQLMTGATDEALATCSEVLADVANLKTLTEGMIDYVVESQEPTADNGYTWYHKYKSGWVEQGVMELSFSTTTQTFTLPVEMADTNYNVVTSKRWENNNYAFAFIDSSTTVKYRASTGSAQPNGIVVSGMSAQ